jgi:hypothetical protein
MSFFQYASLNDLVRAINAANGTSFLLTDLSFSNPKVVAGTWQGNNSDRNSAIKATAAAPAFQGSQVVLYNRLDLGQLIALPGARLKLPGTVTHVWDCLPMLKFYFGISFVQGDLQNTAVTVGGDGTGTLNITADPNSIGWQGSVAIPFTAGGSPIDVAVATTQLPGLNYPVGDPPSVPGTSVYGPAYLYPYDFTTYTPTIINYTPGVLTTPQADFLVAALAALDIGAGKALWNDTTSGGTFTTWNLTGATIVSNGLNDPINNPTNPAYKYVMVLQLRADVTIPTGLLYLHYNDPFDPNNF